MKLLSLIVLLFLAGTGTNSKGVNAVQNGNAELLTKRLNENEAVVWYLGHCGYAVRTKTKLLIFDYTEKVKPEDRSEVKPPANPSLFNGWINPEEIKDLDVVVFVSHSHGDHYDQVIYTWEKTVKKINYVFGWQEKDGKNYYSLPAPRKEAKFNGMEIYTVNSHHSGVPESGFLVKTDGLTIFHQGDYIGRMGERAPYTITEDLKYLKTKYDTVDLLFSHAGTWLYQLELLQTLDPKLAFPMHYGYREAKYNEYAKELKSKGEYVPLFIPEKKGDYCEYRDGLLINH